MFLGRCLSAETADQVIGLVVVEYTFEVLEGMKGTEAGERITFRQVTGSRGAQRGIAGLPSYKVGEDMVLFLHPDSRLGLTSPVGMTQGVFRVRRSEDGQLRVANSLSNRNLGLELSDRVVSEMDLSPAEIGSLSRSAPIPVATLRSAVEKIERHLRLKGGQTR